MEGSVNAGVAFVQDMVVGRQKDIGPASVYISGIFIRGGKRRITGVWLAAERELHIGDRDVRGLHPPADMFEERIITVLHLSRMEHHVPDDEHSHRIGRPVKRNRRSQPLGRKHCFQC